MCLHKGQMYRGHLLRKWVQGAHLGCYGEAMGEDGCYEVEKCPLLWVKDEEAPGAQPRPGTALVLSCGPWRPGQTESGPESGSGVDHKNSFGKERWVRTTGLRFWAM